MILGCVVTDVIAFFIVVACAATLFKSGHGEITDAAQAALALKPFAGEFAAVLFGIGLVNASLLSAAILPLATAYNVCEGMGFESWCGQAVLGSHDILFPLHVPDCDWRGSRADSEHSALEVILLSQVANGVLIPFVLIFMLVLVNRESLMGEMRNRGWQNVMAWTTAAVMIVLTAMMLWTSHSRLKTGGALLLAAWLLAPFLSFPNLFQLVFNLLKFFFLHGQQSGDDGIEAFG